MRGLSELLFEEQKRLEIIVKKVKNRLMEAPIGTLRMSKSHNKIQYYRCCEEKKSGIYISKNNIEMAKKLAQKAYDEKVLKLAERRLSQIRKIIKDYSENEIEEVYLNGVGTVYPDFTFLSPIRGEEIYWEHNGKVDDPLYARNMVKKIQAYENNGIWQGERLILTYETEQTILNTSKIEQLVKRYLLN